MVKKYGKVNLGSWELTSESDSRFNMNGIGKVGWLHFPFEARMKLNEIEKHLGIIAPEDLVLSYTKF